MIIIATVVIIDQALKIWVKCNFALYEDLRITDWFILRFVENNGMAFGMEWGPKVFLTWFRIIAVGVMIYYLFKLRTNEKVPAGYVACISLIAAGALGNVIDCIAYGLIFNESTPVSVAQIFPPGGGYESMVVWWICSISRSSLGPIGCPCSEVRSFSNRYSISPMLACR